MNEQHETVIPSTGERHGMSGGASNTVWPQSTPETGHLTPDDLRQTTAPPVAEGLNMNPGSSREPTLKPLNASGLNAEPSTSEDKTPAKRKPSWDTLFNMEPGNYDSLKGITRSGVKKSFMKQGSSDRSSDSSSGAPSPVPGARRSREQGRRGRGRGRGETLVSTDDVKQEVQDGAEVPRRRGHRRVRGGTRTHTDDVIQEEEVDATTLRGRAKGKGRGKRSKRGQ